MTQQSEQPKQTVININGENYVYETLPPTLQQLLQYHARWGQQIGDKQFEVLTLQTAQKQCAREINEELAKLKNPQQLDIKIESAS